MGQHLVKAWTDDLLLDILALMPLDRAFTAADLDHATLIRLGRPRLYTARRRLQARGFIVKINGAPGQVGTYRHAGVLTEAWGL